ncbi:sensor histidine kinase [Candidatus Avelusimicrobium gallicola]|uniref:histidine kinase n=1 Tax=Candidatus Avelusimicrobium gallicola TaxID=2562704 RepID=A0A1Y4DAD4_9BACT|nr:sensor histidine kinase [Elusimicrobium sp. An273]OUO56194.1 hypothetical protein B5F75_06140 [Elusimicrobium sp. An273]
MTKKRISQSKGERCRVFSCPQHKQQPAPQEAAQGLLGALAPEDLKSIQKHGVEGYDVVAVVDAHTRQATVVSNISGRLSLADITDNLTAYSRPLKQALEGHIQHYEWGLEKAGKHCFYQTTLIPLSGENNQIDRILFLTRDITYWGGVYRGGEMLREGSAPRTFSQILLAARETEKKEISKALHDEIGSAVVILTALLSLVKASVKEGNRKQALEDIAKLDAQIKNSVDRVKNIIVSLRPPSLENDGALGGSVQELLENISGYVHIPYTFDYDPATKENGISDSVKILLYRIVQEALNNIVKHARASKIYVLLARQGDQIRLVVEDDGIGFKPVKQRSIRKVGLLAMQDSVRLLGGTISIKSTPGKGTRIEVACPCVVYGGNE